jgi:hypothetical protein
MNGKYDVWSGSPQAGFNDDFASKGYEYFDVWAPEMATHYGQVFWADQGNNALPADIVKRFANKTMAIVGYEQDQVMVYPTGHPGVNPEQDVSVPINWAYNHHYMGWMTGAHSELRKVKTSKETDVYGNGAHGKDYVNKAFDLPSAAFRANPSVPTSQMFSEGNGGESRKSFHGYPDRYAQLIESPESWHITPMQIDTRNRDCGVTKDDLHKCPKFTPGVEPRQARYGRGIPAGGTNYSGILECPCNGGYGGSPQYYKDHPEAGNQTKHIEHKYNVIESGTCADSQHVLSAQDCFESISEMGVNASKVTNNTVADPKLPFGCSVVTAADGTAVATYNTVGKTPCQDSKIKVGGVATDVGTTIGLKLDSTGASPGPVKFQESAKGVYCSDNHVGILKAFEAKTGSDAKAMTAALKACESFCAADTACNACSVDSNYDKANPTWVQWLAIPTCGPQKAWNGAIPGDVSLKSKSSSGGEATITISGPADKWFAVGWNAVVMSDSPYTIVVNSTSVTERKLGTCGSEAEHCPGDLLAPSVKVESTSVVNNVRTVVLTRPFAGASSKHYTFNPAAGTINYITAVGVDQVFAYHKMHDFGAISVTSPAGVATCVCDGGNNGELCESGGKGCNAFVKRCVAEPNGDLLEQQNPTCNSRQYVGGLSCCKHMRIMLDEDQSPGTGDLLRYHMKWRFWFQEYKPAAAPKSEPSHYDLPRIYFQTEANAGEYDIPPAFSLPGNPVAGYENWPLNKMTPGTSCTGTCPDGPDCECIHTIQAKFELSNTRLVYAGGHCHAPACISIELYSNKTGTPELICRQLPKYGQGDIVNDKYDESGYLALPPCLWGTGDVNKGLIPGVWLNGTHPMFSIKKNRNTKMGHYGEMASWQMRGVNFPDPSDPAFKGSCVRCNGDALVAKTSTCCEDLYGPAFP